MRDLLRVANLEYRLLPRPGEVFIILGAVGSGSFKFVASDSLHLHRFLGAISLDSRHEKLKCR